MSDTSAFKVRKRCWSCEAEWDGYSFVEHPKDAKPLPGTCTKCLEAQERRDAEKLQPLPRHQPQPERKSSWYEPRD